MNFYRATRRHTPRTNRGCENLQANTESGKLLTETQSQRRFVLTEMMMRLRAGRPRNRGSLLSSHFVFTLALGAKCPTPPHPGDTRGPLACGNMCEA
jgi:hypothetical protein